jgi:glycosyltransferase involved in cell wall biosynthesis
LLHRSRDSRDLRDVLRRLITDATLRQSLSRQALKTVQRYDWSQVAREVEAAYERGLAERC